MFNDDEEKTKDLKIYDLCLRAFSSPTIKVSSLLCIVILKQLDKNHIKSVKESFPSFNMKKYREYFKQVIFDMEFTRFINLRASITSSDDASQYFDKIDTGDDTDVFNYNENLELRIVNEEFFIAEFLGEIMSVLSVEEGFEDILDGMN